MKLHDLVLKARTCRHFLPERRLTAQQLAALVDYARLSPSARNLQHLRYTLVHSPEACLTLRSMVAFGGALTPAQRPGPEHAPTGFLVLWAPEKLDEYSAMDVGIAAQSINLAAAEQGLACCIIGNFSKDKLAAWLEPPLHEESPMRPMLVLALGEPAMESALAPWDSPEAMRDGKRLPYFRDAQNVHRVPKRNLEDIIHAAV